MMAGASGNDSCGLIVAAVTAVARFIGLPLSGSWRYRCRFGFFGGEARGEGSSNADGVWGFWPVEGVNELSRLAGF